MSEYSHCRYPEAKIAGTPASQDKLKVAKGLPKGKEKYDYNVQAADQVSCDWWRVPQHSPLIGPDGGPEHGAGEGGRHAVLRGGGRRLQLRQHHRTQRALQVRSDF